MYSKRLLVYQCLDSFTRLRTKRFQSFCLYSKLVRAKVQYSIKTREKKGNTTYCISPFSSQVTLPPQSYSTFMIGSTPGFVPPLSNMDDERPSTYGGIGSIKVQMIDGNGLPPPPEDMIWRHAPRQVPSIETFLCCSDFFDDAF